MRVCRGIFLFAVLEILNNDRDEGYNDDCNDHKTEVVLNKRQVSQEKAHTCEDGHPTKSPNDIIQSEAQVRHASDARDKWGKGADNGDKPGDDNCFPAVLFEEFIGSVEIFGIKNKDFCFLNTFDPM